MANEILIDQHADHQSASRIINLPDAITPQEPATLAQLEARVQNIKFKSAVVAAQGNINIASPGSAIDSYAPTAGSRELGAILLPNQTDLKQNGIWIWNGATTPMTRATDADTSEELTNSVVEITQGTDAGVGYRQGAVQPVIGTDAITFGVWNGSIPQATESVAGKSAIATQAEVDAGVITNKFIPPSKLALWSGRKLKGTATIGDGTSVQFDITHNFGTRDISCRVWENSGLYRERSPSMAVIDANTVRLNFTTAPASNSLKVVVLG